MATITPPHVTPEDLLSITDRPMPELVDGEMVERHLGHEADGIAAMLLYYLIGFAKEHRLGKAYTSQGSYQIFPDDPKKVRIPDGSFIRGERLPEHPTKGHCRIVPDLVFEVISPNDGAAELMRKVADFLAAGVSLIWVIDPETQAVQTYRQDGTGRRLQVGEVLDGEDVLPGFRCEVAAIFE